MPRAPWYMNSIIYAVDIELFMDASGDGIGDIAGLITRLDYLASLGITCLWLMPFYPTPDRDNGYDVSNYYGVNPSVGTLGDIAIFLREAESRGIRVILDLVIQHTSNEHPWFQSARSDPDSPYRDHYIWRDEPPSNPQQSQIVYYSDESDRSPWTYDDSAGAYYLHHFYDFEPDLNMQNPTVRDECEKIISFWLQLRASGFRIDAAPYIGAQDASERARAKTHSILREIRDVASALRGNAVLVGEVDAEPDQLDDFFGDGHELQMLFNFFANNYLFLALAREEAEPIRRAFDILPSTPRVCQWVHWVRNYDELDLERLTDEERQDVFDAFAPDPDMRIYGRGIRRRFPPMVSGDRQRMELAYSLIFSLPGTPCIFMGEEIGMGEDLSRPGREAVRAPMQWSNETNAGFSTADPDRLAAPVIEEGPFAYETINVANQREDPDSFLNWFQRLIWLRRDTPEIGTGEHRFLDTNCTDVLAHCYTWEKHNLVVLHNLSSEDRTVTVQTDGAIGKNAHEILSDTNYKEADCEHGRFELKPYGYRWFRSGGALRPLLRNQ